MFGFKKRGPDKPFVHADDRKILAGSARPARSEDRWPLPQCEFGGETNPATLKVLLKVSERDDYDWVQCSACDTGWQVPHYAAESVG